MRAKFSLAAKLLPLLDALLPGHVEIVSPAMSTADKALDR